MKEIYDIDMTTNKDYIDFDNRVEKVARAIQKLYFNNNQRGVTQYFDSPFDYSRYLSDNVYTGGSNTGENFTAMTSENFAKLKKQVAKKVKNDIAFLEALEKGSPEQLKQIYLSIPQSERRYIATHNNYNRVDEFESVENALDYVSNGNSYTDGLGCKNGSDKTSPLQIYASKSFHKFIPFIEEDIMADKQLDADEKKYMVLNWKKFDKYECYNYVLKPKYEKNPTPEEIAEMKEDIRSFLADFEMEEEKQVETTKKEPLADDMSSLFNPESQKGKGQKSQQKE